MTTRSVTEEAMREGRRWRDLLFAATYLAGQLEKGRISEELALEKLLTVVPDCPHGKLIRESLSDSKNARRKIDDVAATAEAMAEAMNAIAPFNMACW